MVFENHDSTHADYLRVTYNPAGEITIWTQLQNGVSRYYDMTAGNAYDADGELQNAVLKASSDNSVLQNFQYGYDAAGNRTSESIGGVVASTSANNLNQLTTLGQTQATVAGDLNRVATVTVNGSPVPVTAGNQFQTQVPLPLADNMVAIQATASDGAVTTNKYNIKKDQPFFKPLDCGLAHSPFMYGNFIFDFAS